ncbi:MAG: GNAT family N-acetyltransferase [Pisciglobus halotolerans]|nr:GNAT family N-acetyltransferase [Pisciglobus halotolerans]
MSANQHQFAAISNCQEYVIGTAELQVNANQRMRHSGFISMIVHEDYQDKGVGTALLKKLIDVADNWLMLVRVELVVFEDNKSAIHLYEKLGFEKEGLKKYAAIKKGRYEHAYLMARINPNFRITQSE